MDVRGIGKGNCSSPVFIPLTSIPLTSAFASSTDCRPEGRAVDDRQFPERRARSDAPYLRAATRAGASGRNETLLLAY